VIFSSYAPETIKVGEDEYLLMREEDIYAVVE
jgi:co-chaperonin GroES (HSP10)